MWFLCHSQYCDAKIRIFDIRRVEDNLRRAQTKNAPGWARLKSNDQLWLRLRFGQRQIGLEADGEAVYLAGAHDERVVADEHLHVVNLAVIGAVRRVGGDGFGFLPVGVEIVLQYGAAVAERPERGRIALPVTRVWGADDNRHPEFVERDLILDRVRELGADLAAREGPLHFHAADIADDFFLGVDELGLLVTEVEGIFQAQTGDAFLAVEGRERDVLAEREFGNHDGQIKILGQSKMPGLCGKGR